MTPAELERWKTAQIAHVVALGINPIDATKAMDGFLALLPPGADPRTFIARALFLEQDVTSQAVEDDARAAWYGDVDSRVARLLDAKEAE